MERLYMKSYFTNAKFSLSMSTSLKIHLWAFILCHFSPQSTSFFILAQFLYTLKFFFSQALQYFWLISLNFLNFSQHVVLLCLSRTHSFLLLFLFMQIIDFSYYFLLLIQNIYLLYDPFFIFQFGLSTDSPLYR